jgi:hypothetical protein
MLSELDIETHILSGCYRQRENVGKATKQVIDAIADSTPFLRKDKIDDFRKRRGKLTEISNELEFRNPHGYSKYYEDATVGNLKTEVNRILELEYLWWTHCPGLLILLHDCQLSDEALAELNYLMKRDYVILLPFENVDEIKGLEFQHVFIFINKLLFHEIHNGFKGTGQTIYHQRRLMRIPFSRAKDSLVTFALE